MPKEILGHFWLPDETSHDIYDVLLAAVSIFITASGLPYLTFFDADRYLASHRGLSLGSAAKMYTIAVILEGTEEFHFGLSVSRAVSLI